MWIDTNTRENVYKNLIKSNFNTNHEYKQLYLTGSYYGKFSWVAKIPKLSQGDQVNILPIRPITTNINTVTYQVVKYIAKLISPLSTSRYTAKCTKYFIEKITAIKVTKGYLKLSFDVKALFTIVHSEYTLDLVTKRINENHEISKSVTRNKIREILLLYTKIVHFLFKGIAHLQTDGVIMGYPFWQILSGIFMGHLERSLVLLLAADLSFWKRYVDYTIAFIKIATVDHILSVLNNLHPAVQFAYETAYSFKLAFLDVIPTG